jgi:hypothetical protein
MLSRNTWRGLFRKLNVLTAFYYFIYNSYLPTYPYIYLWLYSALFKLGRFLLSDFYKVGLLGWRSARRKASICTKRRTQTKNKRTQTSMLRVGFERTIPVLERAKRARALDCAVTVIGLYLQRLSPLGTAATSGLLYQPQMIAQGDCGAICGMKIGRRNRSTRRKPAPAPLCPPQIPHDLTQARTRA